MIENKVLPENSESQPPSLNAVRDIFNEFNIFDVSDEMCTRVLDIVYSRFANLHVYIYRTYL